MGADTGPGALQMGIRGLWPLTRGPGSLWAGRASSRWERLERRGAGQDEGGAGAGAKRPCRKES